MSLLMQALRKAERARAKDGHEQEAAEPQFGQEAVPSAPPMEGGPAFAVMPDAWRLEPLDAAPPVIPAQEAAHDPVPPQARHEPVRSPVPDDAAGTSSRAVGEAGRLAAGAGVEVVGGGTGGGRANGRLGAELGRQERDRDIAEDPYGVPAGAVRAGLHAPSPARAIASSQRRLVILAGILAALLAVFAFAYWRALSGPGPGARLPMVPMPGAGSSQIAQAGGPAGAGIPVTPTATASESGAAVAGVGAAGGGGLAESVGGAPAGGGAVLGAIAGLAAVSDVQPTVTTAAPPTRPDVDVTIPTPEQLAAIPDPAIRAEAMRDAAERAARQARHETSPSSATPPGAQSVDPGVGAAAGTDTTVAPNGSLARAPGAGAAPNDAAARGTAAPRATPAQGARASRQARRTGGEAAGSARAGGARLSGADGSGSAPGGRTIKTAVGENGDVRFVRGTPPAGISPAVQNGYNALKSGDLATARQQYDLALLQDPSNRDALLGAAAVALREHDGRQASSNYLRLLELNPKDPEALAGLAELRPGDLENNEVKLKGLVRQHPDSGPVQFALGNLLARQGRWPEAQQSYFRAFSAMPDNADYAYNLGIGLDHMNQPRLARDYYRRALELAQASPPTFSVDAVRKRLQVLETPPQ